MDALYKLDKEGTTPIFAAKRLDRLPKHEPDELKLLSVLDKIRQLETKVGVIEEGVNLCRRDIDVQGERINVVEKTGPAASLASYSAAVASPGNVHRIVASPQKDVVTAEITTAPKEITATHPPDGFVAPAHHDKRARRRAAQKSKRSDQGERSYPSTTSARPSRVVGVKTSSNFKGAPPPKRDFFISRVDKSTNIDDISNYITNDIGFDLKEITLISHPESYFCSYKMSISSKDCDRIFDVNIWPEGVKVQRFYNRSNIISSTKL